MPDGQLEHEAPPVPDPTKLTTDQLDRAEERMRREVENSTKLLEVQITGYEKECAERFRSVEQRFGLVERQRVEQKTDTERSVDAAFSAAKEAVKEQTTASDRAIAKSENSMLEQLKQLGTVFETAFSALRRDIDDLKQRMTSVEQQKVGGRETKDRQGDASARLIAGAAAFFAFCTLIASIVIATPG